jgi:hypothetical protein
LTTTATLDAATVAAAIARVLMAATVAFTGAGAEAGGVVVDE